MAVSQKLRLLYLAKILLEKTDEKHSLTMPEIISELAGYGISVERKTIYSDVEDLRLFGIDVIGEKVGNKFNYYVANREFELVELKLLVDSVQAAKFITIKKSSELIRKLEHLASEEEAKQLQRQVYVSGRIKTSNESIYYNVDKIQTAIGANRKITFQYFQWNVKKEQELRHDGKRYCISPWALVCESENYYLIGYDEEAQRIKHYRVDKMLKISLIKQKREGKAEFEKRDMAVYTKKIFGMFDGEEQRVRIQFENNLAGVVIDRFGKEVNILPVDYTHFEINVNVAVSNQFFGWLISLGPGAKIVGPESVVEQMKEIVKNLTELYLNKEREVCTQKKS